MVVYQIVNEVTLDNYIGSSINPNNNHRKNAHFYYLKNNKHTLKKMQSLYNTYGHDSFTYEILENYENVDLEFIRSREQYYINILKPSINISKSAYSNRGIKRDEKVINEVALKLKDGYKSGKYKVSDFHINKLRLLFKGKKMSENSKIKLSNGRTKIKYYIYDRFTLELIEVVKSRKLLMEKYNLNTVSVDTILQSVSGITGDYIIKRGDISPLIGLINEGKKRAVALLNSDNSYYKIYSSVLEFCKYEGLTKKVGERILKKSINHNGYIVKYLNKCQ